MVKTTPGIGDVLAATILQTNVAPIIDATNQDLSSLIGAKSRRRIKSFLISEIRMTRESPATYPSYRRATVSSGLTCTAHHGMVLISAQFSG